jgi:alkylation response protein AidB-like acyl-CoA dehydrogenase
MGMHLATIGRLSTQLEETDAFLTKVYQAVVHDGALLNGAASEPATGSPSRGGLPSTVARRQGDGSWVITGHKTYTTGSPVVQFFLVSCRIEDEENVVQAHRGTFLVPGDAAGVRVEETWNSLGMRGSGSHDLVLSDVHVDAGSLQPAQDAFIPSVQEQLSAWTLPTTAVYLGIAQAARDEAVRFAKRRRPNSLDQPIASVPHIQEKVAKMDLALIQSNAVLFGLAERFSKDPASVPASQFAAAKYLVTNHAVEVVDLAMRLVGGASLSLNLPLQRYYRDVRAGLHHPPMDDATIALLSKQAFAEE